MPKVFICYRRDESTAVAGRIFDRLVSRYGKGSVFWDVDTIPFGVDFRKHISDYLKKCDAFLILIGDKWLHFEGEGKRRLDDPDDYVRIEIETAFSLGILVIPVLIGPASMPKSQELPATLASLTYLNAARLDPGRDFHTDMEKLLRSIANVSRPAGLTATPPRERPYSADISRNNPALFVFLIDQSASMGETFSTPQRSRSQAIADIVNRMLTDMAIRCTKDRGVADYFHVAVLGYGGPAGLVSPAFSGALSNRKLVRISEIAEAPARLEQRTRLDVDGTPYEIKYPVWIEPCSGDGAPMCKALREAYHIVRDWIANGHDNSFPPIVFNITDGAATDGDPRLPGGNITRLGTKDGNVLLFNCCLSYVGGAPILYPDNDDVIPDEYGKMLFQMSSILTHQMSSNLLENGIKVDNNSRGFVFQSDFADIVQFLDMGTRPAVLLP